MEKIFLGLVALETGRRKAAGKLSFQLVRQPAGQGSNADQYTSLTV